MVPQPIVVKVGGSLFDMPDLRPRLIQFLCGLNSSQVALVPGGGRIVDAIRHLDRSQGLGEEASHWLALRALSLNALFLADLLQSVSTAVSAALEEWPELWQRGRIPILDAYPFALADDASADHLPHSWDVTSDSIAARVARVVGARRLVLLKSMGAPDGASSADLVRHGIVDRFFTQALGQSFPCSKCEVDVVNFREWSPSPGK
jgi:5-(aminomethyl)-3-furanmethanol phosphate kinase